MDISKKIIKDLKLLHSKNMVHMDIKPSNILLTNSKVAKIADFGLSKFYNLDKINSFENLSELDSETTTLLKKDNTIPVGTERYMAPEIHNTSKYWKNIWMTFI